MAFTNVAKASNPTFVNASRASNPTYTNLSISQTPTYLVSELLDFYLVGSSEDEVLVTDGGIAFTNLTKS